MSNRKKIVITGASGFLGSHLVERLKDDAGYRVYALSSRPDDLKDMIGGTNVEYLHKDVVKKAADVMKGAIIINCAYPRNSTGTSIADGMKYIQRVFDAAVENKADAIINISSQSVYSQQRNETATEKTQVCLESPYAVGKYAIELLIESICKGTETAYTNLRIASLIGPGFDQRIVNRFVKQAYLGETLHVVKSSQRFGFLDIIDAVRAILSLVQTSYLLWKPVYTVGNGEDYGIEDIVECIRCVFDEEGLPFPGMCIEYGDKSTCTGVSFQLIHDDVGFEPVVLLKDSVRRILRNIQESST